ncbi:MAG: hypothetical protein H7Y42_08240 [Chitinophagaceae bacterium]|nr:hypothetical protein [Chitinophagaceae bacterium]
MESNYNNREFEQFVKRNADQYRMIPSDKVWKGINSALHTRRRWYGIGLVSLLLLTGVSVTWVMSSYPLNKKENTASTSNKAAKPVVPLQPVNPKQPTAASSSADLNNVLSLTKFNKDRQQDVANTSTTLSAAVTGSQVSLPAVTGQELAPAIVVERSAVSSIQKRQASSNQTTDLVSTPEPGFNLLTSNEIKAGDKAPGGMQSSAISRQNSVSYPLTIESVVNSFKAQKVRKRILWQLYIAPTVSYRKLTANKSYKNNSSPFADPITYPFSSLTDVNKAVIHKPDMGLELGFSTRYPISRNVKLRGGLQFNINRYDIKAFVYNGEQATINLSGGSGNNSVTAWTYYRNYNGYKSDWLKNFYFSVSAPIGAEVTLFGNNKTSVGVAGTVQPTYILSDRAYLISTDYKNYAKVPWLIRHMNVNTSFETFINYTSRNNTKWQVGPQVRYQVLSSFQDKYPVRENLFDFGLKIGVTLNQ